jgi:hypothetical protein
VEIIHDDDGQLRPSCEEEREVYGREYRWRCRAGSRYLYICEDGLVHYCLQQRGYPAKPPVE